MQAAAQQAPKLSREEVAAMRRAHDPHFKKPKGGSSITCCACDVLLVLPTFMKKRTAAGKCEHLPDQREVLP
jgi:hypothetical protein